MINCMEQSLKMYTKIGELNGQGMSLNNLSGINYSEGHYQKAVEYFEKDLQIGQATGDRNREGVLRTPPVGKVTGA